jgi:hypothetical protein
MRVAVLVIGLILLLAIGLQSCLVTTGEAILGGLGGGETVGGAGPIGLLVALLFGIAAAFALGKPAVSVVFFVLAALLAFMAGSTGFSDMKVWGVFALVLALLSFFSLPDAKGKIKTAVTKWWFWLIVALVILVSLSTCMNGTDKTTEKKQQTVASTKKTDPGSDQFVIQIGSKNIQVNDMELTLDAPVREIDWHSYVPLRFFLDWFEAQEVTYDRATETVTFKLNRCKEINPAVIEKYHGQVKIAKTDASKDVEPEKPVKNSRKNPAGLNEAYVVSLDDWLEGKVTYEIEMLELISGTKALEMVRKANPFNDEPEAGKEYILAKFRVAILDTQEDKPYSFNHAKFNVISGTGVEYTGFLSVSGLEPDLRADLYEGASHIGWTYFLVDINDHPVAVMDRGQSSEIWFDLRVK